MNKIEKLKRFLQKHYPNIQAFDCRGCLGDDVEEVYNQDGISVLYCSEYNYIEIFGLTAEEFEDLLDPDSFLGESLRTFSEVLDCQEEFMMYKINYETMPKFDDYPTSPFEIQTSFERKLIVDIVEKIDREIIKKYEEIAAKNGINDLILLSESEIKEFLQNYLPIYMKEKGLK